jgi:hypothetical protein
VGEGKWEGNKEESVKGSENVSTEKNDKSRRTKEEECNKREQTINNVWRKGKRKG